MAAAVKALAGGWQGEVDRHEEVLGAARRERVEEEEARGQAQQLLIQTALLQKQVERDRPGLPHLKQQHKQLLLPMQQQLQQQLQQQELQQQQVPQEQLQQKQQQQQQQQQQLQQHVQQLQQHVQQLLLLQQQQKKLQQLRHQQQQQEGSGLPARGT